MTIPVSASESRSSTRENPPSPETALTGVSAARDAPPGAGRSRRARSPRSSAPCSAAVRRGRFALVGHEEPAAGANDLLLQPGPSPAERLGERRGHQPGGGPLPPERADALEPLLRQERPGGDRPAAQFEPRREQRGLKDAEHAEREHDHHDEHLDEGEAALRAHDPPPGRRDRTAPCRSPGRAWSGRLRRRAPRSVMLPRLQVPSGLKTFSAAPATATTVPRGIDCSSPSGTHAAPCSRSTRNRHVPSASLRRRNPHPPPRDDRAPVRQPQFLRQPDGGGLEFLPAAQAREGRVRHCRLPPPRSRQP